MSAPVVLVEAYPRRAADGVEVRTLLAGLGGERPYYYAGEHWRAGLTALPRSVARLDHDGLALGGGGVADAFELVWAPATQSALADAAALVWNDAPIAVYVGPEGDALPPMATSGLVLDTAIEGGALTIAMADGAVDLKRPLLVDRFGGTGGLDGPADWAGQIRTRAWGRCFNVPGKLLDRANQIWCFGDPARSWQGFVQVRDKGVAATAVTTLAWQGSAAATFAALQAAAAPAGGCVVCPSIACVKWWTEPAGDLYADILGENAGGYVETAAEIAARIVAARSTLAFGAGELARAIAARPAPIGWRVASDSATAAGELSELLGGVSLSWLVVDGAIVLRAWDWTASTRVARSHKVTRREVYKPVATVKLGYRRNWSPMQRSDIAASVLATDIAYEDGTPIDALRPAEGGANVTEMRTARYFFGQAWAATEGAQAIVDNRFVRTGVNLIPNSDQTSRVAMILLGGGVSGYVVDPDIDLRPAREIWNTTNYALAGRTQNVAVRQIGHASGAFDDGNGLPVVADYGFLDAFANAELKTSCSPGERIVASIYVAAHRCSAVVYLQFMDGAGATISSHLGAAVSPSGSLARSLDYYNRPFVIVDAAPAGTVSMRMVVRKYDTAAGEADSYIWFAAPMLERANASQTGPSKYTPGPTASPFEIGFAGDLDSDKTNRNTAAYLAGQGALATLSALANGSQYLTGFGLLSQRSYIKIGGPDIGSDSFALLTAEGGATSNNTIVTALGTALYLAGQGPFATATGGQSLDNGGLFAMPNRLLPFAGDSNYLVATRVAWADGNTVEAYKPGEAGANVTENRTAAYLSGQGPFATATGGQSLDNGTLFALPGRLIPSEYGAQYLRAERVAWGENAGGTVQDLKPGERGANVTENRTAAYLSGQGPFATATGGQSLDNGGLFAMPTRLAPFAGDSNYLVATRVAWADGNTVEAYKPGEAGANVTENRTARYLTGQGALATLSQLALGSGYLSGFGSLAAATFVQFGASTTVRREDGSSVTDSMVVTAIGTAQYVAGQGALATADSVGRAQILLDQLRRRDQDFDGSTYQALGLGQEVWCSGAVAVLDDIGATGDIYIELSATVTYTPAGGRDAFDSMAFARILYPNGSYSGIFPATNFGRISVVVPSIMAGNHQVRFYIRRGSTSEPAIPADQDPGASSVYVSAKDISVTATWRAI